MLCCPRPSEIKKATSIKSSVLPVDPVFVAASDGPAQKRLRRIVGVDYIQRYGIACDRLTGHDQYDHMCFMLTSDDMIKTPSRYLEPFAGHGADGFATYLLNLSCWRMPPQDR